VSQREASVKLTLDDGEYVVSMRKAGDEAEAAGRRGEKGMKLFASGIKGAQAGLGSFMGTISKATGLVTGLAAGFSVGQAMKGAVELDAKFKQLAFSMSVANKKAVSAAEIQSFVERAAAKSGRRTAELADAFDELSAATGDMGFSSDVLEDVGLSATATGKPIGTLVQLADQLHTKFGVTAGEMGDALAQVFEASKKGGPSLEEFAAVSGAMGAELLQAGLSGRRGLDFMLGSLVQTDDEMKNLGAQVKGVKQVLLSLGDANQIKAIAKSLAINPSVLLNEKDLMGRMKRVLGMGKKGLDALKGSMKEAEEQKALRILFTDPFEAALKDANASGQKGKAAIDSALRVLDQGMADFGKATINGATIQAEASERMKDPQMRLQIALEQLERSFARPEIISAIEDLSIYLPGIAKTFGDFVKFAAQNPLLAGALGLGASVGLGAAKGVGSSLLSAGSERAGDFLSKHAKAADLLGDRIGKAHELGGLKLGNAIRGAGALAAIAMAAALAKEAIDQSFGSDAQSTGDLSAAGARASSMKGGMKKQLADADALRAAIRAKKESQSGVSGFTQDLFGGLATMVDSGAPNLRAQNDQQIAEMEDLLKRKEARIMQLRNPNAGAGGSPDKPAATVALDPKTHRDAGRAVADALRQGSPVRVELVGGIPGAPASRSGGGGSRGPTRPGAAAPGGGNRS
jgi:hypothetical protein